MLGLDVLAEAILIRECLEVGEDLLAARVNTRPVMLWLEGPGVVVRWDVASASRLY
jgi:hypothetical protein